MVKSILGVYHQGLRDWMIQRVSALVMAIYSVGLIVYIMLHPALTYMEWRDLIASTGMKIATLLFLVAVIYHAWIGMWTVFTDYVKPFFIRACLNLLVLFSLAAGFIWSVLILWSV